MIKGIIGGALFLLVASIAVAESDDLKAVDVCAMLSLEDVQAVVGEPIEEAQEGMKGPEDPNTSSSQCAYNAGGGSKSMDILVWTSKKEETDPNYIKSTLKDSGVTIEDVEGVGDSAFWGNGQLQVFVGKHRMIVVSNFGFEPAKEKAVEIVKKLLEKM